MIPFDTIRSAVLSEKPWSEMDRLVRAELSAGRLTSEIYVELNGLSEEVLTIPGLTEQGEDAFGDTLDLLIGFCPAGREYQNVVPAVAPSAPSRG